MKLQMLVFTLVTFVATAAANAALVLNGGWQADTIDRAYVDSSGGPYVFSYGGSTTFSITDNFITGDTYFVYDFGTLILTTSLNGAQPSLAPIGDVLGDLGWTDASYEHGSITLAPGGHSLTIQGNGAGGVPAGFYIRLDDVAPQSSVPEPTSLAVMSLAMVGLGAAWRRKQAISA